MNRANEDKAYLDRTADRLRVMAASQVDLADADAGAVRERLRRMKYGGSRLRNQGSNEVTEDKTSA
jgi:hypothetical protein